MSHFSLFLQELFNRRPAEMQPPGKSEKEEQAKARPARLPLFLPGFSLRWHALAERLTCCFSPGAGTEVRGAQMGAKKIGVVTGGSGLIGGTIVNFYKTRFPDTVDIRAPSSKKMSIRSEADIRRYLNDVNPDFVINAAMARLSSDGQMAYEVNYLGPVNLARAANALNIPYIHISSSATLPPGENLREEDTLPLTPHLSNYAKSKLMAELTLKRMAEQEGLDYTCIRLAIVYGAHDHKIQGFHRLFFSIADESMPVLFTKKNTLHSYSNARKLPFFINHVLANRAEFSGKTYNFVDKNPVDLANLILTIKAYLQLNQPKEIYVPYWLANSGKKCLDTAAQGPQTNRPEGNHAAGTDVSRQFLQTADPFDPKAPGILIRRPDARGNHFHPPAGTGRLLPDPLEPREPDLHLPGKLRPGKIAQPHLRPQSRASYRRGTFPGYRSVPRHAEKNGIGTGCCHRKLTGN